MADLVPESEQQYGSILTVLGESAEQNGKMLKKPVEFTHIAFGDANDTYVQPDRKSQSLVNELYRIPVNSVDVLQPTPDSVPILKVEALIPDDIHDIVIREFAAVATFNGQSYFHAVGNCARVYVPNPVNNGQLNNPVSLEMTFVITSAEPIVEMDPNVITASRDYVNDKLLDAVATSFRLDRNNVRYFSVLEKVESADQVRVNKHDVFIPVRLPVEPSPTPVNNPDWLHVVPSAATAGGVTTVASQRDFLAALSSPLIGKINVEAGDYTVDALQTAQTHIHFKAGATLSVMSRWQLDGVNLTHEGDGAVIGGAGEVVGVLSNKSVPHNLFACKYNLVRQVDRNDNVIAGDIYLDPLLGDDLNDGVTQPVRSVQRAAELIAAAQSVEPLTVVMRAGRVEFSEKVLFDARHSLAPNIWKMQGKTWLEAVFGWRSNAQHSFKPNPGERVFFTPETQFLFVDNADKTAFGRAGVATTWPNSLQVYDPVSGLAVPIGSNRSDSLPRNQVLAIAHGNGEARIKVERADYQALLDMGNNVTSAYIVVWEWFVVSWSRILRLEDGYVVYRENGYSDGYHHYVGKPAPYYLANVPGLSSLEQFLSDDSHVYLPETHRAAVATKPMTTLLGGDTSGVRFEGVTFRWVNGTDDYHYAAFSAGMHGDSVVSMHGQTVSLVGCDFSDLLVNGAFLRGRGHTVEQCRCLRAGAGLVGIEGEKCYVAKNDCEDVNRLHVHRSVIEVSGTHDVFRNKVRGFGYIGIRVNPVSGQQSTPVVKENIVHDSGTVNGKYDESRAVCDGGGIYVFGRISQKQYKDALLKHNVVFNIHGHKDYRGVFFDDGVNGTITEGNLVFNVESYTLDLRAVGGQSYNNVMRKNVLFGPVRLAGEKTLGRSRFDADNVVLSETNNGFSMEFIDADAAEYVKDIKAVAFPGFIGTNVRRVLSIVGDLPPHIRNYIQAYAI